MQIRLPYLLSVLLFLMTGPLCHLQQEPAQVSVILVGESISQSAAATNGDSCGFILPQSAASDRAYACWYFTHSLLAPALLGDLLLHTDYKALSRSQLTVGCGICARPAVAGCEVCQPVDLHARGVDYYVYALERILI